MRKTEYQFVVIFCKLQDNGYGRCNASPQDCRQCVIGKAAHEASRTVKLMLTVKEATGQ